MDRDRGAALHLENLTKVYSAVTAVEGVNMEVAPGEFITFLGPSGSGKTTTLSMVAGFTIPSAGDIRIDGASTVSVPVHQRNIGMVFQNYALFPHLSIAENIGFPLKMRGWKRDETARRVNAAMEQVRLDGYGDRKPKQLSGGQQQRVALARAMVFEARLILLDEPLGALDANLREEMKVELKELHRRIGATILFVTHDQEEALTLSDRVAVFQEGRLVQVDTPTALYNAPLTPFVADFIGEANQLTGGLVEGDGEKLVIDLGGLMVTGRARDGFPYPEHSATFTLRHEAISIGQAAAECENRFGARVEEYLYSGGTTKILFSLNDSVKIAVRVGQRELGRTLTVGEAMSVGWSAQDMLLIASE